jgi:uncharacterized protein YjiK
MPTRQRSYTRRWLAAGVLVLALEGLWVSGLVGLASHALAMRSVDDNQRRNSLSFDSYTVGIEGTQIDGLPENVSGLTFSSATGTLFTAINRPPELAEIDAEGRFLRRITLTGASDVEGITHVDADRFIVIDEGRHRLSWVTITPGTTSIDLDAAPFLTLDLGAFSNMGFEGISWDQRRKELVLVQEMWPVRVLVIGGLDHAVLGQGLGVSVREWHPDSWAGHFVTDLSSVTVHDPTGNMVLLSDMSSILAEYAPDGAPVSLMTLWTGWHGLTAKVPQAEGVAIGPDGAVYIVSEPNLFYRFDNQGHPAQMAK